MPLYITFLPVNNKFIVTERLITMISRYFQVGACLDYTRQSRSFLCRYSLGKVLSLFSLAGRSLCSPSKMKNLTLRFTKITANAYAPTRGSKQAAGYDLYSAYDYLVPSKGKQCCSTDLKIAVPEGSYGRIAPRSGLAHKNFIDIGAGVIDHDYRGNVGVILFNFSEKDFEVKKGDRIAQLICEKIYYPEIEEVQTLDETQRGEGGFGSSGRN